MNETFFIFAKRGLSLLLTAADSVMLLAASYIACSLLCHYICHMSCI